VPLEEERLQDHEQIQVERRDIRCRHGTLMDHIVDA
jgi:hypothetical protein